MSRFEVSYCTGLIRTLIFAGTCAIVFYVSNRFRDHPVNDVDFDAVVDMGDDIDDGEADGEFWDEELKLFHYDPIEVGYVRRIEISPGRIVEMKTIATKPPLFEVPGFLSDSECDHIISLAKAEGLHHSFTRYLGSLKDDVIKTITQEQDGKPRQEFNETDWNRYFTELDQDGDQVLDYKEAISALSDLLGDDIKKMKREEILLLYHELKVDSNDDTLLNKWELLKLRKEPKTAEDLRSWLKAWRNGDKEGIDMTLITKERDRVSENAWVDWHDWLTTTDDEIHKLRKRVALFTKLDEAFLNVGEVLQVAYYRPGGHYNSHYDSQRLSDSPCVVNADIWPDNNTGTPRLCRMATLMFYLNNVDEGGETAFPLADVTNISSENFTEVIRLTDFCHKSRLRVRPEKGKAVFWYNHHLDFKTNWVGDLNRHSLHGGCDVIKGTKWIANHWIWVDTDRGRYKRTLKKAASLRRMLYNRNSSTSDESHHAHDEYNLPKVNDDGEMIETRSGDTVDDVKESFDPAEKSNDRETKDSHSEL